MAYQNGLNTQMIHYVTSAAVDETLRDLQGIFARQPVGAAGVASQLKDAHIRLELFGQWVQSQEKQRCAKIAEIPVGCNDSVAQCGPMIAKKIRE